MEGSGTKIMPAATGSKPAGKSVRLEREPPEYVAPPSCASARKAVLKSAPTKLDPGPTTIESNAPAKLAPVKSEPLKDPYRLALVKLAPVKLESWALVTEAAVRLA